MSSKQLGICGHPFEVSCSDIEVFGDTDVFTSSIRINNKLSLRRKGETLLHEAGHSFAPTLSESETGHALWDILSAQSFAFLWDNGLIHEGNLSTLLDHAV